MQIRMPPVSALQAKRPFPGFPGVTLALAGFVFHVNYSCLTMQLEFRNFRVQGYFLPLGLFSG